jgi:hypothetical protein
VLDIEKILTYHWHIIWGQVKVAGNPKPLQECEYLWMIIRGWSAGFGFDEITKTRRLGLE